MSRDITRVDLGLHNTNRHDTINGPAIAVPPLQAKIADSRPSCRDAVLDAIERLHQRTGLSEFARRDIVAEVQAASHNFERQTIYGCLRRLTGYEPGSAHHDLDDLGNDQLRLRGCCLRTSPVDHSTIVARRVSVGATATRPTTATTW